MEVQKIQIITIKQYLLQYLFIIFAIKQYFYLYTVK